MKTTDSQLIVSISDQGLGIPKKDLPLILTVFTMLIRQEVVLRVELVLACPLQKKLLNNIRALFGLRVSMVRGSTFTIVLPYDKDAMMVDEWEM